MYVNNGVEVYEPFLLTVYVIMSPTDMYSIGDCRIESSKADLSILNLIPQYLLFGAADALIYSSGMGKS